MSFYATKPHLLQIIFEHHESLTLFEELKKSNHNNNDSKKKKKKRECDLFVMSFYTKTYFLAECLQLLKNIF